MNATKTKSLKGQLAAGFALAAMCSFVHAEDVYELAPHVVTGDLLRTEAERLPSSVTLLDADSPALLAASHFEDLLGSVPNLNWAGGTSRPRYFQVRGIGENSQFGNEIPASSVGFMIDGIDFTGIATVADLFDVVQVEVLRGPQAAAFGANALAGMVVMETAPATAIAGGKASITIGEDNLYSAGVAIGGRLLPDGLNYRFSVSHHQENGFRENTFLNRDNTNGRQEWSARMKLDWTMTPVLRLGLTLMAFEFDNGYDAWALDNDSFRTSTDEPGRDEQQTLALGTTLTWLVSEAVYLQYTLSVTDSDILYSYDWDWSHPEELRELYGPEVYWGSDITERQRVVWSQDIRLQSAAESDLEWVAGIYLKEFLEEQAYFGIDSDYATSSAALYGQARLPLAESVSLTLAGRIERHEIDFTSTNPWSGEVPLITNLGGRDEPWGGKLAIEYSALPNHLFYAAVDRGYKAGGVNLDDEVPAGFRVYGTEKLWNYELGWRASFLERRLRTRVTLFFMDREDIQVDSSLQLGDGNTFALYKDNAASGSNYGTELELDWQVSDNWRWFASVGLLRTQFDDYNYIDPSDNQTRIRLDGREQAYAPRYTFSVGTEYAWNNGLFASVSVEGKDSYLFDVLNEQSLGAYTVARLRLGYRSGGWQYLLWINNLANERYDVRGFYFANEPPWYDHPRKWVTQGAPRQAGISVMREF